MNADNPVLPRRLEGTKKTYWLRVFVSLWLSCSLFAAANDADWPQHGGRDNIRYSPLDAINRSNVSRLKVAWTYDSHDAFKGSEMQSNPVVVDGTLYVTTPTMKVVALNAATGAEVWTFDPSNGSG